MKLKEQIDAARAKFKFYFTLNHEFSSLRREVDTLVNCPPWLPLFNQDRFRLVEKLNRERLSNGYKHAFTNPSPLVSVRIATYNNSKELIDRALDSVLKQTYKNWEVIIVGDYTTDDTREQVKLIGDRRVKYFELPYHYPYPDDQVKRWMAQGLWAHNEAVRYCRGDWIAPLDDDNEFLPYHIELLLEKAKRERLEIVYGNMISIDRSTGEEKRVGGFPPQVGNFDFSASLYHKALAIFPFDINSFHYLEVGDVNLMRRYKESGVRIGFLNKYVTKYYFRQPGSIRTRKNYPNKDLTYIILNKVKKVKGKLDYDEADRLLDGLEDSTGDILLFGEENKKLSEFVRHFIDLRKPRGTLVVWKQNSLKGSYNLIVINNKKTDADTLVDHLSVGGIIYSYFFEIEDKRLKKIEKHLYMKV